MDHPPNQTEQFLGQLLSQRRHFFGRPWDNRTLNDAKAFIQQSSSSLGC